MAKRVIATAPLDEQQDDGIVVWRKKPRIALSKYWDKLTQKNKDKAGREIPDPTPMAPPLGYVKQPSMVEHIREMIRGENLRKEALNADMETFEEADDFDVGDDTDPISGYEYEENFEPAGVIAVREAVAKAEERAQKAAAEYERLKKLEASMPVSTKPVETPAAGGDDHS